MEEATEFLNVDLDVVSNRSLRRLARALESLGALTLHCGGSGNAFRASFELSRNTRTVESTMRGLVRLVQQLPPDARSLWDRAKERHFNVGIQAGIRPHAHESAVSAKTLGAIARLRAKLVLTIYAATPPQMSL